jgi:hypothetical protein
MREDPKNKFNPDLMFRLVRELWIETENCRCPIRNLGDRLFEISKGGIPKELIVDQWDLLLEYALIEQVSEDPPEYRFTEKGKGIQTENDLVQAINE